MADRCTKTHTSKSNVDRWIVIWSRDPCGDGILLGSGSSEEYARALHKEYCCGGAQVPEEYKRETAYVRVCKMTQMTETDSAKGVELPVWGAEWVMKEVAVHLIAGYSNPVADRAVAKVNKPVFTKPCHEEGGSVIDLVFTVYGTVTPTMYFKSK
jgi:hypothetical protein